MTKTQEDKNKCIHFQKNELQSRRYSNMIKLILLSLFIMSTTTIFSGEAYYLISHGIVDASVISIYGWGDNKTPCETMEKFMNRSMENEKNYHKFSCVDSKKAMSIDCKDKEKSCIKKWEKRNELIEDLE
jgi:hypothetical protein